MSQTMQIIVFNVTAFGEAHYLFKCQILQFNELRFGNTSFYIPKMPFFQASF